jgi:SAM-dependent methyltransferase
VADWAKTIAPGSLLVDVGAGACRYAPLFSHCKYTPQDSPDVDYAPLDATDDGILRSDITSIPLDAESVDAILCTEVLEHVERPLEALSEFARLLKPHGQLLLSVPSACRVHRVPTHYYGGFAPDFFERCFPARRLRLDRLQPIGNWSQYMAQELGRMPQVIREHTRLPPGIATALSIAVWPTFRIAVPSLLLAFSWLDLSDDLPLGWIAYASKL